MKKFAGFLMTAVLAVTVVACSDTMSPAAPSTMSATEAAKAGTPNANSRAALSTIAGTAVAAGRFTTLVYALDKAGLVATFDGSQQFTVFAPNDAAFEAAAVVFGKADGKALVDFLYSQGLLAPVLTYHVTQGDRRAQGVLGAGQIKMLDGNWAAITVDNGVAKIDGAPIVNTDIVASNGIIHELSGVMLPPGF